MALNLLLKKNPWNNYASICLSFLLWKHVKSTCTGIKVKVQHTCTQIVRTKSLSYWGIKNILRTTFRNAHSLEWKSLYIDPNLSHFSLGLNKNIEPSLIQVMAWTWTGEITLPEPMMIHFNEVHICHWASGNNIYVGLKFYYVTEEW